MNSYVNERISGGAVLVRLYVQLSSDSLALVHCCEIRFQDRSTGHFVRSSDVTNHDQADWVLFLAYEPDGRCVFDSGIPECFSSSNHYLDSAMGVEADHALQKELEREVDLDSVRVPLRSKSMRNIPTRSSPPSDTAESSCDTGTAIVARRGVRYWDLRSWRRLDWVKLAVGVVLGAYPSYHFGDYVFRSFADNWFLDNELYLLLLIGGSMLIGPVSVLVDKIFERTPLSELYEDWTEVVIAHAIMVPVTLLVGMLAFTCILLVSYVATNLVLGIFIGLPLTIFAPSQLPIDDEIDKVLTIVGYLLSASSILILGMLCCTPTTMLDNITDKEEKSEYIAFVPTAIGTFVGIISGSILWPYLIRQAWIQQLSYLSL